MTAGRSVFVFISVALVASAKASVNKCVNGWDTIWYNSHTPTSSQRYDLEAIPFTDHCKGGTWKIRCKDNKNETLQEDRNDIALQYTATCNLTHGLVCGPWPNSTMTCPDFSVQIGCSCPGKTTPAPKICWDTQWYNNSAPTTTNRSDYESQPAKVLDSICNSGSVISARCRDEKGEPFQAFKNDTVNQYIATCDSVRGLICHPYNNTNKLCADFEIQYGCSCPTTTTPSRTANPPAGRNSGPSSGTKKAGTTTPGTGTNSNTGNASNIGSGSGGGSAAGSGSGGGNDGTGSGSGGGNSGTGSGSGAGSGGTGSGSGGGSGGTGSGSAGGSGGTGSGSGASSGGTTRPTGNSGQQHGQCRNGVQSYTAGYLGLVIYMCFKMFV